MGVKGGRESGSEGGGREGRSKRREGGSEGREGGDRGKGRSV